MLAITEQIADDVLVCPKCLGSGYRIEKRERIKCSYCDGRGHVSEFLKNFPYKPKPLPKLKRCPTCGKPLE